MDIDSAGADHRDVIKVLEEYLVRNGFSPMGADGYETITNQRAVVSYADNAGIQVSAGLLHEEKIDIRMQVRDEEWTKKAGFLYDGLAAALESYWSGAVYKEPPPEN